MNGPQQPQWKQHTIHTPLSSSPRRPARPDIWMYSPDVTHRNAPPSYFFTFVNTTVLAGMFRPVENVSAAHRRCEVTSGSPALGGWRVGVCTA